MHVNLTMEERLKDMRVNRRMTLEELAKATGISSSALANYENRARDISHRSIIKLAETRGITLIKTRFRMFTACGLLYTNGLSGGTKV